MKLGIIAAMEIEAAPLIEKMTDKVTRTVGGVIYTEGTLCGVEAVIAVCGIGKVFAAMCAEAMILTFHPEYILHTGVAGSLSTRLKIGDLVIADKVVQHDMDTSPLGDPVGLISGINEVYLPCDAGLIQRVSAIASGMGIPTLVGTVASGDQFISDTARKAYIRDTFQAVACEMEGAAVGQVCFVNKVPFLVIRAISDDASGEAQMDYPRFAQMAAKRSVELVLKLAEGLAC